MPASAKLARLRGGRRVRGVKINRFLAFGVIACGLAACSVGPDYQAPEPPMPASFIAAASSKVASSRAASSTKWWRTLHDRELDSLIDRAIAGSPTLEIALNRIQQARAQEAVVVGAALPAAEASEGGALGTGSDLARSRVSQPLVSAENGAGFTRVSNIVGFDAGWEIDIFGKFRRAIEAAQYDVDAAIAARNMVLISLVADVTRAYLDLRALQMQLAVLRKNIEVAQKYVDFVKERYNRGITNELDVTLAQRELAQLQAQVAPLIARIDAARYVIAVLLGEFPENLGRETGSARVSSGAAGADPVRVADRSVAPAARRRRSRAAIGQRHRADRRRDGGSVSARRVDRFFRLAAGHRPDRGRDQSDLVGRPGRRLRRCWISAGSTRSSRKPTSAAANFCSTTNKPCSTRCAKWTPRSMPMPRSKIACVTSPMH